MDRHFEVFVERGVKALALGLEARRILYSESIEDLEKVMDMLSIGDFKLATKLGTKCKSFISPLVIFHEVGMVAGDDDIKSNSYDIDNALASLKELLEDVEEQIMIDHGVIMIDVDGPHNDGFGIDPEDD